MNPYNYTPGGTQIQTRANQLSRETNTMISDAKNDFRDPLVEDFDVDGYPTKIECSPNGNKVYYGGDGLGELVRGNDKWLYNKGLANSICKSNL